jgi:hypothetical protein
MPKRGRRQERVEWLERTERQDLREAELNILTMSRRRRAWVGDWLAA